MKLEIYGGTKDYPMFSGHGESDVEHLKPCPFCKSTDILVENTHTPFYQAECGDCGALGPRAGYFGDHIRNHNHAELLHREAFNEAVEKWNRRR